MKLENLNLADAWIENMKTPRGNNAPNQFLIELNQGKKVIFQSYNTIVAIYLQEENKLYIINDIKKYTNTTARYLKSFMKMYFIGYNRKKINELLDNDNKEEYILY